MAAKPPRSRRLRSGPDARTPFPGGVSGPKNQAFMQRQAIGLGAFFLRNISMRLLVLALTALGAVTLAGCNTIEGVGKDVRSAGDTVAKTADRSK